MTKSENTKYQCGCGKIYSSYPAFSNHKKSKHANHPQPGTRIPKPYAPKRGRPAFTLPQKHRHNNYAAYAALTCVEVGLLKLEEQHKGLLSEAEEQANLELLNPFDTCERASSKKGTQLTTAIRKFTEVLLTHLNDKLAETVVDYLVCVCEFILENIPSEEAAVNWDEFEGEFRVDCALFNRFFQKKGQLQRVRQMARRIEVPVELMLNLTVLLSQYLSALDLASSTLALKA